MKSSFASSLLLAAGLVAAVPARAEVGLQSAVPAPIVSTTNAPSLMDVNTTPINGAANPRRTGRFGWATVGIYNVGFSVDVANGLGGTQSFSASSSYFGISGGAAFDVLPLMPELQLSVFGNAAVAFGSDFFLPLDAGLAIHYDALPVMLFFGPAFSLIPHSGNGDTLLGVGLFFMGSYPVPQLMPGMSFLAQFQYHILNDSAHMIVFDVGASLGF